MQLLGILNIIKMTGMNGRPERSGGHSPAEQAESSKPRPLGRRGLTYMSEMKISLPIKPDSDVLDLLIKAKLWLAHGLSHSGELSVIDRMIAIHNYDCCIEYLLRIIIRHLEIEQLTGSNFDNPDLAWLAGEVDSFLFKEFSIRLPYFSDIKNIRRLRNNVQHGMIAPPDEINKYSTISERIFDKILFDIFGVSRDELRISSLIENSILKEHLKRAEEYLDQGKYLESIVASRDVFENILFFQIQNSSIKFDSVPAIVESASITKYGFWFFSTIASEIELLRLGIQTYKYQRFSKYIDHVPGEYWVEKSGWSYMPRPWDKRDALFCYGFVSDVAIKWQGEISPQLYSAQFDSPYKFVEDIGGVRIDERFEGGCRYSLNEGDEMYLIYVNKELKEKLNNLFDGNDYLFRSESYKEGVLENKVEYQVHLLSRNIKLFSNSPSRWEVILWFKTKPFTWKSEEFREGKLIKKSPNINEASVADLIEINPTIINEELAQKIILLRDQKGKISSEDDLKGIKNITKVQIKFLADLTCI